MITKNKYMLIKVLRGILLYGTIIYDGFILMALESISNINPWYGVTVFFIGVVLTLICTRIFSEKSLKYYTPKWIR